MLQPVHRRGVERRRVAETDRAAPVLLHAVRMHLRVVERVKGQLGREVQVLILASIDLTREVLHRRNARIQLVELADPRWIRTIEDVPLADRKLRIGTRHRQHAFLRHDGIPQGRGRPAAGKTATHADNGDWTIHICVVLYHKKRK